MIVNNFTLLVNYFAPVTVKLKKQSWIFVVTRLWGVLEIGGGAAEKVKFIP